MEPGCLAPGDSPVLTSSAVGAIGSPGNGLDCLSSYKPYAYFGLPLADFSTPTAEEVRDERMVYGAGCHIKIALLHLHRWSRHSIKHNHKMVPPFVF